MRMYRLVCLNCEKVWFSSVKDPECAYCGSKAVADTGQTPA